MRRICIGSIIVVFTVHSFAAEAGTGDSPVGAPQTLSTITKLTPAFLESAGTTIGNIRIVNENIFDNNDPRENRKLHRWANALHIKTKPDVVGAQLLFQSGDAYTKQIIEETERLLRSNRYLREAEIVPSNYEQGIVDLDVHTTDVWSLSPSVSFGRGGGKNSGGIGLKEYDLLGRGTTIGFAYKSDVDRDTIGFRYFDRHVFSSRYQLAVEYTDASDGYV